VAGDALKKLLEEMQQPEVSAESDPGQDLHATLRPYQRQGAHWLWFMNRLGLGACLADDMGLGKTIQVLSLLLVLKRRRTQARTCQHRDQGEPADCASLAHRQLES
jgi:SNF2 family DNA or RNA helicase